MEAALSLSIFIFAAAMLLQPLRWLDRQRKIQAVVECFCEDLSRYAYAAGIRPENDASENPDGEEAKAEGMENDDKGYVMEFFSGAAADLWLGRQVKNAVGGELQSLRVKPAQIPDHNGDIRLELDYREGSPPFLFRLPEVHMRAAACRRAWIGLNGKLRRRGGSEAGGGDGQDRIVYVGKNMGRYHMSRDCHYLSNDYRAISDAQAGSAKNSAGRTYRPCARCQGQNTGSGVVFVTPVGEHYHESRSCSAMVSYVRALPLREAEYLGPCSYCAKGDGGET